MSEPKNIHHINQLSVAAHSDQKLAGSCCASSDGETSFDKIVHQTCDVNIADGIPPKGLLHYVTLATKLFGSGQV